MRNVEDNRKKHKNIKNPLRERMKRLSSMEIKGSIMDDIKKKQLV